ncbi:hypothetical protein ACFFJX_27590 [Pseudarcicella hirudinis]|uniref:hypothetical protein n=1 Tax=Pseudarcicella hirudinis TaxID=1079859 RepID=UPI0035E9B541
MQDKAAAEAAKMGGVLGKNLTKETKKMIHMSKLLKVFNVKFMKLNKNTAAND